MANVKQDFLAHTQGLPEIKCAVIRDFDDSFYDESGKEIFLKKGYTEEDLSSFLRAIDFDYHDGFGHQEVYGCIWFEGGTWSERRDYDGAEWWEYKSCPKPPKGCR